MFHSSRINRQDTSSDVFFDRVLTFKRRLLVLTYQLVSMSTNLTRWGTTVYKRYAATRTNSLFQSHSKKIKIKKISPRTGCGLWHILRYKIIYIYKKKQLMSAFTKRSFRLWLRLVWSGEDKFLKMIQIQYEATEWLTTHLSLEELNEGLCEGLDPLVHDVVTLFRCVFIVEELNVVLLRKFYKHKRTSCHIHTKKKLYIVCDWSQKSQKQQIYLQLLWPQCDINRAFCMCSVHNHVSKGDAVAQWSVPQSCVAEGSNPGCQKGIRCKTISKSLIWVC